MNGGGFTTTQIMLLVGIMGLFSPIMTGLVLLFLNRLFGGGDTLRNQVHQLELAQKDMEARIGGHVRDQFATKEDIRRLEKSIDNFNESQKQYHESLLTVLKPLADQLIISPVVR